MSAVEQLEHVTGERFATMYEALAQQGFGPLDAEVAKAMRFRPQAIRKLPMERRARKAREIILARKNAELAYEFLGAYLMKSSKELVTGFLDATGVPHEDGMIEDLSRLPDRATLDEAVRTLDEKHGAEDVTLYLALCAQQWPEVEELADLWRKRLPATV